MSLESFGIAAEKIGLIAVVVLVGFVISKLVARFLVDVTVWSNPGNQENSSDPTDAREQSGDPADEIPGLHVFSEYGGQGKSVNKNPTEEIIRSTIRRLDWVDGFHHVWLVTPPGESLEVSGSLDPDYGLSSAYRDWSNNVVRVIKEPPISVDQMEDLLVSFHLGDGRWEKLNEYE